MTTGDAKKLYPLRFREILRDYGFGDRWITREFAKTDLPEDHRIAETWEVCDRKGESSEIINGPLAGASLREAIDAFGERLLGADVAERFGGTFPLLIKFLDATHKLAEQVHPDDQLTRQWRLDDHFGKTEAWYMLKAKPSAQAFCGNRAGVTADSLGRAVLAGTARDCMRAYTVSPGDAFLLYAGTMHYSPGGLLFYEIMQNSDVYVSLSPPRGDLDEGERRERIDRAVRAVHLEEPFDCKTRPVTLPLGGNSRTFILACEQFILERLDITEPLELALDGRAFRVLSVIEGSADVATAGITETLAPGSSCLLPACLSKVRISPRGQASALVGYVGDLVRDVIEPLRQAGIADEAIRALGGRTGLNALSKLL